MTALGVWALLVAIASAALVMATVAARARHHQRAELARWSQWIDEAIAGRLLPLAHDESVEASLSARLRRLLLSAREAERRLGEEKDAIQSLIGSIAHQTKTPMTNISLYAELAAEGAVGVQQQAHIDMIIDQAAKLDTLVSALVKAAYLESGAITITPVPCQVGDVVAAAVREIDAHAQQRRCDILTPASDALCLADPAWIGEVLVNLLDNAVKYSPNDSVISVRVEQLEVFCRIDVCDAGVGIAEEETASIFRRFYRSPRTADVPGLGIGLSLTRQVVALHAGFVRVRSAVDRGSTFSVYLPRADLGDRADEF
ncbi:sensor histidine kinase [Cellulosimicrobium cellulans]|uniref:sensor histidine kinase n=1 Tax=Cellulosimicrobium cellulans TaxID=1710 RepID=UPI00130EDB90|nr:HAMP domain-containing sensor histidine kinase [Cellulosimicrobium cellulans]